MCKYLLDHRRVLNTSESLPRERSDRFGYYFDSAPHSLQTAISISPKAPTVGAAESDQAFLVAGFTAYPQKSVFEPAALHVVFEFPLNIAGQLPAFLCQLLPESRVVLRDQLIE